MYNACVTHNIRLEPVWVPMVQKQLAVYFSRIIDWYINQEVYKFLDAKWGPHMVDRFATCYNAHVDGFNCMPGPGLEAVDTFRVEKKNV